MTMGKITKGVRRGFGVLFEYETQKIVQINSKKVGVINRLLQLLIIGYVIGWVMVYKKGYQDFENVVSGVVTKVKGVSFTNRSDLGERVWDVADYVIPPQEKDAFFVTTNAVFTPRQKQGKCPEDPDVHGSKCESKSDCQAYEPIMLGNGVKTGNCVDTYDHKHSKPTTTCEIYAWCPVEVDILPKPVKPLLTNVPDFTVLIKNSIAFPKFGVKRFNVLDSYNTTQLQTCSYDPDSDKYCPVFKLGKILNLTGNPYDTVSEEGAVIAITINWDCDLDLNARYCLPTYSFSRLDDKEAKIAKGMNFRYANYYSENGTQYRDLYKAYGIRFTISVTGKAGKFNIIPLTMNLGSGLALLGVATILCDMVVLYILSKRESYKNAKYDLVEGDDAYNILEDSTHLHRGINNMDYQTLEEK